LVSFTDVYLCTQVLGFNFSSLNMATRCRNMQEFNTCHKLYFIKCVCCWFFNYKNMHGICNNKFAIAQQQLSTTKQLNKHIIYCVVTWPVCRSHTPAHRSSNHTLNDIPPIIFVFQVTQRDIRSSLMMAGYCRNM
jgi:hypothetical protein